MLVQCIKREKYVEIMQKRPHWFVFPDLMHVENIILVKTYKRISADPNDITDFRLECKLLHCGFWCGTVHGNRLQKKINLTNFKKV